MKHRLFFVLLIIFAASCISACADTGKENTTTEETLEAVSTEESEDTTQNTTEETVAAIDSVVVWENDGVTKITDPAFDRYFTEDAASGITELLDNGNISVNGIVIPANENSFLEYQLNGDRSLYKSENGWSFRIHGTEGVDDLPFAEARKYFVETLSTISGNITKISLGTDSLCKAVDISYMDCVRVEDIVVYNESTTIKRGDFDLDEDRTDVEKIVFNSKYFDQDLAIGDIALYWYGSEGWRIQKALSDEVTLQISENELYVAGLSHDSLITSNRPDEFYAAYNLLEPEETPVIIWYTESGYMIGATYIDAKTALSDAIEKAESIANEILISQEEVDEYNAAIEKARSVYNNNLSSKMQSDYAIYELSIAVNNAINLSGWVD